MPLSNLVGILGVSLNPLSIGKDVADAFVKLALDLFGSGASSIVTALLGFVTTTSDPVFSGGWWSTSGQAVFTRVLLVSGSVMALAYMCSIITALLSGDRSIVARATLRLPIAVLEMALLVGVTGALVVATDQVSVSIASGATGTLATFAAGSMATAVTGSGIVGLFAAILIVLGALAVWAELLCRTALIYVAVMAGPLIFAASVHPSVRGLKRRYVEGALALICSKVVVAIAFATGSAMLSGLGNSTSFSAMVGALMEALTILLVAAFAPFILLKLLLGAETILAAEGLERRPGRAAIHGAQLAGTASGFSTMVRGIGHAGGSPPGGSASGGGGPSGSGGGGPGPVPRSPGGGSTTPPGSGAPSSTAPRSPASAGGNSSGASAVADSASSHLRPNTTNPPRMKPRSAGPPASNPAASQLRRSPLHQPRSAQ